MAPHIHNCWPPQIFKLWGYVNKYVWPQVKGCSARGVYPVCLLLNIMSEELNIRVDLKCVNIQPYRTYVRDTNVPCAPKGWSQVNDDCWLDSSLYAMFGSRGWHYFSTILEKMHNSEGEGDEELKTLATQISNYLNAIEGKRTFTRKCKQQFKNLIVMNYLKYFKRHHLNHYLGQTFQFHIEHGNVTKGSQDSMFRLFEIVARKFGMTFHFLNYQGNNSGLPEILNQTQTLFDAKENGAIGAIIIDLSGIKKVTVPTDIKERGNYSLVSWVSGSTVHAVAGVQCFDSDLWRGYDNQKTDSKESQKSGGTLPTMLEHVTLVYVRDGVDEAASSALAEKKTQGHGAPESNGQTSKAQKSENSRSLERLIYWRDVGAIANLANGILGAAVTHNA